MALRRMVRMHRLEAERGPQAPHTMNTDPLAEAVRSACERAAVGAYEKLPKNTGSRGAPFDGEQNGERI